MSDKMTLKFKADHLEMVNISDLLPYEKNFNMHPEEQIEQIISSIKEFGFVDPLFVDDKNRIIAGHGRLESAKRLGIESLPIIRLAHLSESQKRALLIADNKIQRNSVFDIGLLTEELKALSALDFDLSKIGFSEDELVELFKEPFAGGLTDEDSVPEIEKNIHGVKAGDVWQLGNHRLMCGDSTSNGDVEKLMAGENADMVFTDPPYGLGGYGGRNNMALQGDDQDPVQFYHAIPDAKEVYVWGRVENWDHINFKPRDVIVWRKNNFGLGKGYRGQYEVCFYKGGFDGSDSDVWDVAKDINYEHPTQKPVALAERAIKNSQPKVVLDIFLGSGSTIIACEKTNRKCYGMEIDPHYCSVIIERWNQFTGKKAVKIGPE